MNKQQIKAYNKAYREINKDKLAKQRKAYREINKDKLAKQQKAYYEINKDKLAKQQKAWLKAKAKHKREHPEEYLNVLGRMIYTNGVTKQMEKMLPELIDKKIKEMLK